MKISLTVAGVVLLGASLAACGGSDGGSDGAKAQSGGGDYCKQLESAKTTFDKVSQSNFDALDSAIETFHKLADTAPVEVKAEWQTLDNAFSEVEAAFKAAGIKMSDLGDLQEGKVPKGADVSKLSTLGESFSAITSEEVSKAQATIQKHGKETCKVDLGMS